MVNNNQLQEVDYLVYQPRLNLQEQDYLDYHNRTLLPYNNQIKIHLEYQTICKDKIQIICNNCKLIKI